MYLRNFTKRHGNLSALKCLLIGSKVIFEDSNGDVLTLNKVKFEVYFKFSLTLEFLTTKIFPPPHEKIFQHGCPYAIRVLEISN